MVEAKGMDRKMYTIAKNPENRYCNYFDYAVQLCGDGCDIMAQCIYAPVGRIAEDISVIFKKGEIQYSMMDFAAVRCEHIKPLNAVNVILKILLSEGREDLPEVEIAFLLSRDGINITSNADRYGFEAVISGWMIWGKEDSVSAVCIDRMGSDLRSAYGPAASKIDDALFDRETDCALRLHSGCKCRISYDFDRQQYGFTAGNSLHLWIEERVFASRFHVKYKGINKHNTFPTPPAGWMTWYAVKFDACEEAVLENAQKQKELFADYGANAIWVDWEWYHSALRNETPDPDIHYFQPDPVRYPNGLKYVADKIREKGFIPALWVAPTNEPVLTDFMKENEHSAYIDHLSWCGRYFYDLTNEAYLKVFLPKAVNQVREWGYDALKWDCLPITLGYADKFHFQLSDPGITSEQALRRIVQTARDILGEDFYMMSCSGEGDRDVLVAGDIFDGARIGGDIFAWKDFIRNFLERIMRYYAYHNNMFYCDPDNLIVRPEYNNYEQTVTRTSFVAMLGLPLTLGDDLRELPQDRVELIRRALPPLDIRPMDVREMKRDSETVITNLLVKKIFEEWNVVHVANLSEEEKTVSVDLDKELHLDSGTYLVYDFWAHKYLGMFDKVVALTLQPYESAVISVRKYTGKKQLVSTSRHISQGAFDLMDVWLDEEGKLHGRSKVVAGEPYIITYYEPDTQSVLEKCILSEKTQEVEWVI